MKIYLALTTTLFAALTIVHVWRLIVEPGARNPWMYLLVAVCAVLCAWAARLWIRASR